jgi:hypothetical protein
VGGRLVVLQRLRMALAQSARSCAGWTSVWVAADAAGSRSAARHEQNQHLFGLGAFLSILFYKGRGVESLGYKQVWGKLPLPSAAPSTGSFA